MSPSGHGKGLKRFFDDNMRKTIHTILLFFASSALWTGCDGKAEPAPVEPAGRAIGFSCGAEKSRAQIVSSAADINNFRVWAGWTKGNGHYTGDYMDGQLVKREGVEWIYSPVVYIPTDGSVDFFAYSPADAAASRIDDGKDPDLVSFTYDVTTDLASQHDFMVAGTLDKTTSSVHLYFQHMLSSVRVEARSATNGVSVRVYEVRLLNLCRQGVLTGEISGTPRAANWSWSGWSKPAAYTIPQNVPVDVGDTYTPIPDPDADPDAAGSGPVMILPQTVLRGNKNDLIGVGDIGTGDGKYPEWMLDMPKDIGTRFYIAVTYEPFDLNGSMTKGVHLTAYQSLSGAQFVFAPGGNYLLHVDI